MYNLMSFKEARIEALLNAMFAFYEGTEPRLVEVAQLRNRLESLIALRERLV